MVDRFTAGARRSLFFARYRAGDRDGDSISDEDLLHGVSLGDAAAVELLGEGAAAAFRSAESGELYVARIQRDSEVSLRVQKEIPFSQDAWEAVQFAIAEADALVHEDVGGEHLLLGLLRNQTTNAYRRLNDAGVRLSDLRLRVKAGREGGSAT